MISFDFSPQATCPSDNPYSLAQTVTECNAPGPLLRSWPRRKVLPSIASVGRSTPVSAAASSRSDRTQAAKHAWNASGRDAISTRRMTSLHGTPCGSDSTDARSSSLMAAHSAIAVGPTPRRAPRSTR